MRLRMVFIAVLASFGAWGVLHAQRPFREYEGREYNTSEQDEFPLPADWGQKTEWTRARLRYPAVGTLHGGTITGASPSTAAL